MAKDLGGFLKSFAGGLGGQLGGASPFMGLAGQLGLNPLTGVLGGELLGKEKEDNPGMKMFKGQGGLPAANEPNFGQRFLSGMRDQLFQNAMQGFMGRGPY